MNVNTPASSVTGIAPDLLRRCIANDASAQKLLYETYARKLFLVSLRYLNDREMAKDILQDAFVKIFKNLSQFSQQSPLEAWMSRIVANTALNQLRALRKHPMTSIEDQEIADEEPDDQEHYSHEELLSGIEQLGEEFRTVFNLYVFEEYSHAEIARMLGINENTSCTRLNRARTGLKKYLLSLRKNA